MSLARKKALVGAAPLFCALGLGALGLSGCGDVQVGTDVELPKPLVDQLPMTVGVYYSDEFRKYEHAEERWGTDWNVQLGQYHVRMGDRLFQAAFRETVPVKSLDDLPSERPLRAVIEPRIEQYSFITPRDTGAKYFAVTIRYRLNVFTPDGRLADSLTFTGYGSSPSSGITSTSPMILATKTAMRDAAAKFLVQFPEQPITKRMIAELPLIEEEPPVVAGGATPAAPAGPGGKVVIESVPILDTGAAPTAPGTDTKTGETASPQPNPAPSGEEAPAPAADKSSAPAGDNAPAPPASDAPPTATPPTTTPPTTTPPQPSPRGSTEETPGRWTDAGAMRKGP